MKQTYPSQTQTTISLTNFERGINTQHDEELTDFSYATDTMNFSFQSGALRDGVGFERLSKFLDLDDESTFENDLASIGNIEKVIYFYKYTSQGERADKLIFINDEYGLFYIDLFQKNPTLKTLRNVKFSSVPIGARYRLNGEDVIIMTSETDNMVVWDGENEPYSVLDAPKISSMAIHYERLFATVDGEKNAIWFSDDLDPTNWSLSLDEAGFIEMIDERGALLKVVSFLDYIYIFREFGISRLTAYGDQTTFAVSNLFVSSGKIYSSSVCVCGDRIIFLADDGLYSFDGVNTTKILDALTNNFDPQNKDKATACYYDGKYYLACNLMGHGKGENNSLVVINVSPLRVQSISGNVEIKDLCFVAPLNKVISVASMSENAFLPTILCKNASFLGNSLEKTWISPRSKLGNGFNKKCLRTIEIDSNVDLDLEIFHDENKSVLHFKAGYNKLRLSINLTYFGFKVSTTEPGARISRIAFTFSKAQSYF